MKGSYFRKNYQGYELTYYLQPGIWMGEAEIADLKRDLEHVNRASRKNFRYGIFDPAITAVKARDFLAKSNICLIRDQGEAVGFFYNNVLQINPFPVIHAGLVLIAKNRGVDLIRKPYAYLSLLQYFKYGPHYYTSISSTPSIVGIFSDLYQSVWPSPRQSALKPPSKEYLEVLRILKKEYIDAYFPGEGLEVDAKRFVLRSTTREMGFETDLRRLPRYHDMNANLFCLFWLDYSKGEDMIQIGRVGPLFALREAIRLSPTFSMPGMGLFHATGSKLSHAARLRL